MASSVKNIGREATQVGIILEDGKKATIRVMPRTKKPVSLPAGSTLDANWMALNGKNILEFTESQLQQAAKDQQARIDALNAVSTKSKNIPVEVPAVEAQQEPETAAASATEEQQTAAQTVTSKT